MKKLLLVLLLVCLLVVPTFAGDVKVLPNPLQVSSGFTMYDFEDHDLKIGVRYPAVGWKFLAVDGDLITDMDTVALGVGLGLELVQFARWLGLEVYLSENVNFGYNGAYNFRDKCAVHGPFVSIKF